MTRSRNVVRSTVDRLGPPGEALYALGAGFVAVALVGVVALLAGAPVLVPSLGPSAMLFFEHPMQRNASPRHVVIGHVVALAVGYLALLVFGLADDGAVMQAGWSMTRAVAAGVSLGLTAALLIVLRAKHPPAGATALIVTLGLVTDPGGIAAILAGVVVLAVFAFAANRALGVAMPAWEE